MIIYKNILTMKKIIILGLLVHLISCSENQETFERKENKEEEKSFQFKNSNS